MATLPQDERDPLLSDAEALRELERIYRDVDALFRGASCLASGDCCQLARTGLEPNLFPIELRRIELALSSAGRPMPPPRADGACPLLDASGRRCSIYPDRPFGCRTYFCGRGRGLPKNAAIHALSARLTRLSDALVPGVNPQPLRSLLAGR